MTKSAQKIPELICPAGTPASLRTAIDAGADAIYCGFIGPTNARNFPGLNFTIKQMEQSLNYARERGAKLLCAINSFATSPNIDIWKKAIDDAVFLGVDAIIIADIGMAKYVSEKYPNMRIHLSVQAGASSVEAINFYIDRFNIKRVVLPRILTISEIKKIHAAISCEIEAFIFGNIGMMAEGRCSLTNYVSGKSTNMDGVCSPAEFVSYEEDENHNLISRLGEYMIDCIECGQSAGYPTICKGRYNVKHRNGYYAFEEPISLNLTYLLPDLIKAGVSALKIEGRQRSKSYIREVVSSFRKAVDAYARGEQPNIDNLLALTEGHKQTEGAFKSKIWR